VAAPKTTRSFETRLGYRFKDAALLDRALTHSSARVQRAQAAGKPDDKLGDNERLEFLGDRVLGLAIAELLSETFTAAAEGELARRFNNLVRGGTCADVARSWDLGQHVKLSDSEAENGGRDKDTILADACEAILAAIFLEAGFETARDIVRQHWTPRLNIQLKEPYADAKSALQEWAQGQGLALPVYKEISREGPDHAPVFTTEVRVDAKRSARGIGASKRIAEQAAATKLLSAAGVWKVEK
jgi:ribonuclease III